MPRTITPPIIARRGQDRRTLRWLAFFCLLALVVSQVTACSRDGNSTSAPSQTASAASPMPVAPQLTLPPDAQRSLNALATHSQMFRFGHLTTDMGLSQSVVNDLLQDDQGFLWLATQDGLNRYDGAEFQVFKDDPDTPNSLRGNLVADLAKAPTGEVWIGTNGRHRPDGPRPRLGIQSAGTLASLLYGLPPPLAASSVERSTIPPNHLPA